MSIRPASSSDNDEVRYRISPHNKNEHIISVEMDIPARFLSATEPNLLRWPTWIPGSYLIREFARNVVDLRASQRGEATHAIKIDKATWKFQVIGETPLQIKFYVYAFDRSVRGAFLDAQRFYFNGAAVFPEWVRHLGRIDVDIFDPAPIGQVATTLPPFAIDASGFGRYQVENYDALIDYPVEISKHDLVEFDVAGVPHAIVVTDGLRTDLRRIASDTEKICASHVRLFHGDAAPPFARYLFLLSVLPEGYGGLEHRDSTSLICAPTDLPIAGDVTISEGYLALLGLISHEYFHAWNVKRIRPAAFIHYDLQREIETEQLWMYEGFTSYYDDLALVRAGVITQDDYLRILGRNITALARNPGRFHQSIAQASFDSWIKYYRPDENTPNSATSYYLKGSLTALLLDLTLRATQNCSLDALMRSFFEDWSSGCAEQYLGTNEDAVEKRLEKITGQDWHPWFETFVYGTAPLPLESALASVGVSVRWRPATSAADRGGRADTTLVFGTNWHALGLTLTEESKVKTVFSGSAAAMAGISSGDTIVALNQRRASGSILADAMARIRAGDKVSIHLFREGILRKIEFVAPTPISDTAWCERRKDVDLDIVNRRNEWLGATT